MSSDFIPQSLSSWRPLLFFFSRYRQPEYRCLSLASHIQSARSLWIGQIQGLTVLAAIHFGIPAPRLFDISTRLLQNVGGIKPSLEMPAAEFSLGVFLVAGALSGLLELHFMVWQLGRRQSCGCGQSVQSSLSGNAAEFPYQTFILLEEFCGTPQPKMFKSQEPQTHPNRRCLAQYCSQGCFRFRHSRMSG